MLWATCCLVYFGFITAGRLTSSLGTPPENTLSTSDIKIDSRDHFGVLVVHIQQSKTTHLEQASISFWDVQLIRFVLSQQSFNIWPYTIHALVPYSFQWWHTCGESAVNYGCNADSYDRLPPELTKNASASEPRITLFNYLDMCTIQDQTSI